MSNLELMIQKVSRLYCIPEEYKLGRDKGISQIITAASFCFPELKNEVYLMADRKEILPTNFKNVLTIKNDILGGIITELPIPKHDRISFKEEWIKNGLRQAVAKYPANLVHVEWSKRLVSTAWSILNIFSENGYIPKEYLKWEKEIGLDNQIFSWLTPIRYILHIDKIKYIQRCKECELPTDTNNFLITFRDLLENEKSKQIRKDGLRRRVSNKRQSNDLRQKIERLKKADQQRVLHAVLLDDQENWLSSAQTFSDEDIFREIQNTPASFASSSFSSTRGIGHRGFYNSFVCGPHSIGHCQFEKLCVQSIRQYSSKPDARSASLLVFIFLFCEIGSGAYLTVDSSAGLIGRTLASFPENLPDEEVHRPSGSIFWLPAPKLIIDAVRLLGENGKPSEKDIENLIYDLGFDKIFTIARIKKYLLFNGCSWQGYGSVLPRFGFFSSVSALDVPRSYLRIGPETYRGYVAWLQKFFPQFKQPNLDEIPPSGSQRVARLFCVREMYSALMNIITHTSSTSVNDLLTNINAGAGLTHLLAVVLLGGFRNYPIEFPEFLLSENGWMLNFEKQIAAVNLPVRAKILLNQFNSFKNECFNILINQGIDVSDAYGTAYAPLKIIQQANKYSLKPSIINWNSIREALLESDLTWKYSLLDRNALRHFSMTELYSSGEFSDEDIQAFHQRSLQHINPCSSGRLEDPLLRNTRELCSDYLFRLISNETSIY